MKTISTPKNKIWVRVEPHKNIRPFIKCNQRIKKVLPNQLLISVSKIIMMQTNGIDKNYIEIQCLGFADKYYLDISLTTMCKNFPQFKRINKKQVLNIDYVNGMLGDKYLFVDQEYFKVSDRYKEGLNFINIF